ncbi:hypothetical protein EI94DRAFT_795857 [Lactarius quietus]|nr:hypothetical protein EI94DRAFT_66173 [Lactarius quietus]KAF8261493.1 hypothetical protein EI94DRAFT_795857 [Lactarius quietus]
MQVRNPSEAPTSLPHDPFSQCSVSPINPNMHDQPTTLTFSTPIHPFLNRSSATCSSFALAILTLKPKPDGAASVLFSRVRSFV